MEKNEAINKIKEQLKKLMAFAEVSETEKVDEKEEVETEMEVLKTKDGKEMMKEKGTDTLGATLMEKTEEGMVKCGRGKYEMEDGSSLEVDEEGKVISETKAGDVSPENPAEMAEVVEEPTKVEIEVEGGEEMKSRVEAIEAQISQILEIIQGLSNSTEMALSKVAKIASEPAGEPIKTEKKLSATSKVGGNIKSEMEELREIKKKFKFETSGSFSAKKD
jgi:hypothetical protein